MIDTSRQNSLRRILVLNMYLLRIDDLGKPKISVKVLSPYSASITILNQSIQEEAPYVVCYKSLPQVISVSGFHLDDFAVRTSSSCAN